MRMQEVIVKLREEAPKMEAVAKTVDKCFAGAMGFCRDLEGATSDGGRLLLRKALFGAMLEFQTEYERLWDSIKAICAVNAGYKEKLGVSRRRKQKDAPGQQMLDLGDQVTSGQSTSPATSTALPVNATAQGFDTHGGGTAVG